MKLKTLALSALLVAPTYAQNQEGERKKPDVFDTIDRNHDGKLQQQEIDMAIAVLRQMDRNKDGDVSREEWGAPQATPPTPPQDRPADKPEGRPMPGGDRRRPVFEDLDKNGDGKISKDEAPERMRERFDQMDGNGDGFMDKTEFEEVMKRLRERMQGGGGKRPNKQGPGAGADTSGGAQPKRPPVAE